MKQLRFLLPTLLVLVGLSALAVAQTITRSVQLSQDTTGAFGTDANNNIYFPAHMNFPARAPLPTVSSGATTPTISGTDAAGAITVNAAATTVTATFGRAYLTAPFCIVTANNSATAISYTTATTSLAITAAGAAGAANVYRYFCPSLS